MARRGRPAKNPRPPTLFEQLVPRPVPSDLKFEVWRLKRSRGWTYGRIAVSREVGRFLSPKSRAANVHAVRLQLAKRFVKAVDLFLATPIGSTYLDSWWWQEWLETGYAPGRARLEPFPGFEPLTPENHERWVLDNLVNFREWRDARRRATANPHRR